MHSFDSFIDLSIFFSLTFAFPCLKPKEVKTVNSKSVTFAASESFHSQTVCRKRRELKNKMEHKAQSNAVIRQVLRTQFFLGTLDLNTFWKYSDF